MEDDTRSEEMARKYRNPTLLPGFPHVTDMGPEPRDSCPWAVCGGGVLPEDVVRTVFEKEPEQVGGDPSDQERHGGLPEALPE